MLDLLTNIPKINCTTSETDKFIQEIAILIWEMRRTNSEIEETIWEIEQYNSKIEFPGLNCKTTHYIERTATTLIYFI
jgi:hypothetical protein